MSMIPAAQYSIVLKLRLLNVPGVLGEVAAVIGEAGGNIYAFDAFEACGEYLEREIVVNCSNEENQTHIIEAVQKLEKVEVLDSWDRTFKLHEGGKIEVISATDVDDNDELSMAYTPGVARVCLAINEDESVADTHTIRKNTVAIVSDGTAVLGLGDIGPKAAMPVMEGKALLFKEFAGVDAFPLCIDTSSPQEVIETVERLAPSFGGVNLEDIAAPGAFEIEEALKKSLDIPVFHDDQHGTAVVALAALQNALKVVGKSIEDITVVMTGLGAAGIAVAKMMLQAGVGDFIGVDRQGVVYEGRDGLNTAKQWLAENSNTSLKKGSLSQVMAGADVFVGLSGPGVITVDDVKAMAADPIVFAMANPNPEIQPELVVDLVAVMATGRSDYPNQINNVLAFPGIFRGALDAYATDITENMKLAAAKAIAETVTDEQLAADFIIPSVFDKEVAVKVAEAVAQAAKDDGVSRQRG